MGEEKILADFPNLVRLLTNGDSIERRIRYSRNGCIKAEITSMGSGNRDHIHWLDSIWSLDGLPNENFSVLSENNRYSSGSGIWKVPRKTFQWTDPFVVFQKLNASIEGDNEFSSNCLNASGRSGISTVIPLTGKLFQFRIGDLLTGLNFSTRGKKEKAGQDKEKSSF